MFISNAERYYLLRHPTRVGFNNKKELLMFLCPRSKYKKVPCKHGKHCLRKVNRTCSFGHGEYNLIKKVIIEFREFRKKEIQKVVKEHYKKQTKALWQQKFRAMWGANYSIDDADFRSLLGFTF